MNKKILIITPKFYPSIWWIEEQVKLLWINFNEKWYKVDILTNKYENQLKNKETLFWLNIFRFSNILFYIFFLLKNKNYEIIISRQYYKNSFILWLLKLLKLIKQKTIIVWDWWTHYNEIEIIKNKIWVFSKVYFYVIWKNNFLIWNNKYYIKSLLRTFNNQKVKKIYNWINIDKNYKQNNIKEINNILYISRFDKWKWYIEAIESFKKIKNKNICLNLIWYWDIEAENKIKKLILSDNRIKLFWKKYWVEKDYIINKSDLFIFPSYYKWESFWVVLYEIANKGIPIISTNFWDTKKIFWNNIIYVKKENIEDLKNKIEWIIDNIKDYKYNYKNVLKKIDINNISEQFLNLK